MVNLTRNFLVTDQPIKPFIVNKQGQISVLRLKDLMHEQQAVTQLKHDVRQMIEGTDKPRLILDMQDVNRISSMMLGVIMALNLRVKRQDGEMRMCHIQPDIMLAFSLVKLDVIVSLDDTLEDSYEAFESA